MLRRSTLLAAAAAAAILICGKPFGSLLTATESASIIAVEEDWSLTVGTTDANTSSPQITMQMFPDAGVAANYGIFCVNYQEIPRFAEGGIELQLWEGDWNTDVNGNGQPKFSTGNETVTWTQSMKIHDGRLQFGVKDGHSTTFGDFGGDNFKVLSNSNYSNLAAYNTDKSIKKSGVTLGSNRVTSLKLLRVRYYKSDDTVVTDENVRHVVNNTSQTDG